VARDAAETSLSEQTDRALCLGAVGLGRVTPLGLDRIGRHSIVLAKCLDEGLGLTGLESEHGHPNSQPGPRRRGFSANGLGEELGAKLVPDGREVRRCRPSLEAGDVRIHLERPGETGRELFPAIPLAHVATRAIESAHHILCT
jgi:hypothetical protein